MAKTFTCTICNATFHKASELYRHRRHTNHHEVYACTICQKRFTANRNLKCHLLRHQRGFDCPICQTPFPNARFLYLHTKQQHGQVGGGNETLLNPKDHYALQLKGRRLMPRFGTFGSRYAVNFKDIEVTNLPAVIKTLTSLLESILTDVTEFIREDDLIQVVVENKSLDFPINLPPILFKDFSVELLLTEIEKVLQSNEQFAIDESLELEIIHVVLPTGSGRKRCYYVDNDRFLKDKQSILRIQNDDHLCCARAIVTAKARLEGHPKWERIRHGGYIQQRMAEQLHEAANVPHGPCGIDEIKCFQNVLSDYQIIVVSRDYMNNIIYQGPESEKKIYLYHHDHHYDVITTMTGFLSRVYYCTTCQKGYDHLEKHACNQPCPCCRKIHEEIETEWVTCTDCGRYFKGKQCYDLHRKCTPAGNSTCKNYYRCPDCGCTVEKTDRKHVCGETYCQTCKEYVDPEHQCFMKPADSRPPSKRQTYIFFDFECTQDDQIQCQQGYQPGSDGKCVNCNKSICGSMEHQPNLCVVHKVCTSCMDLDVNETSKCKECGPNEYVFQGPNTAEDFCQWLFSGANNGATVLCHNFQGYDSVPILQYLYKNGVKPEIIANGTKNMSVEIKECKIRMIDSLNFFPTALAKLPDMFGFTELHKGYFPHLFNRKEHQTSHLPTLPEIKYYNPDSMKPEARDTFLKWYHENKDNPFSLRHELLKYCRTDVDILRKACLTFRNLFMTTAEHIDGVPIDPFQNSITLASACNLLFRAKFLQPDTIGLIPAQGYRPEQKQSIKALKWIKSIVETEEVRIQHARNGGEKRIGRYLVDGYRETESGEKIVYEFNGCFWHGCPKCYAKETINPVYNISMNDLYQRTMEKQKYLENQGYTYICTWECEAKQDPLDTIETPLEPRDAFYGGRTEAFTLYQEADGTEIDYYDVTSLYPFINKTGKIPMGHPKIITEHFEDISKYEGLIKCKILPPQELYIPVLPCKINNKLLFALCRACAHEQDPGPCIHNHEERAITGTWVTDEVKKAIEKGYRIVKVYEVWHFETEQYDPTTKTGGLFTEYINTFLKLKQEASGWPEWCTTESEKQRYIEGYFEKEGILLEYDNIKKNPGLRALAKLMLNSFWGKFGQRNNMVQINIFNDPSKYMELLTTKKIQLVDIRILTDNMIEVRWKYKEEFVETSERTNVVIAAYTTAQARLKLYTYLDTLGPRTLYCDTDSIVFSTKPGERKPSLGDYLGDLTDEIPGNRITHFVTGGPKNYAYKLAQPKKDGTRTICKVRGITLNYKNALKINYDLLKEMVVHDKEGVTVKDSKITRNEKRLLTVEQKKNYRLVFDKRVLQGRDTVPYGF